MPTQGVNHVTVLGNMGADPEVRYMPSGGAVANISIATTEFWNDRQTGNRQERVEWHRVTLFGRMAEVAGEYLRKGHKVCIQGRLQTDKWQDRQGNDRYTTKIIASDMQLLTQGGQGSRDSGQPQNEPRGNQGGQAQPREPGADDDFDDDIPF